MIGYSIKIGNRSKEKKRITSKRLTDNVFFIVLTLLIFWGSGSVYYSQNPYVSVIAICVCLILIALHNLFRRYPGHSIRLKEQQALAVLIYLVIIVLLPCFWGFVSFYYFYVCGVMLPLIFIIIALMEKRAVLNEFIWMFVSISTVFAVIALLLWLFGSILGIIRPTGYQTLYWGENFARINSYYNIYFETQNASLDLFGIHLGVRNDFVFPESPVCCFIFMSASVLNELYINSTKSRIILLLMILSTLSTTGYLYMGMFGIYMLLNLKTKSSIAKVIKMIFVMILGGVVICLVYSLLTAKLQTGSGITRANKILTEWQAFLESPIFGHGFDEYTNGSSNSLTALMADGGLLLWIIYYYPLAFILISRKYKVKFKSIGLIFYCVFAFTVAQYSMITAAMIAIFLLHNPNSNDDQVVIRREDKDGREILNCDASV